MSGRALAVLVDGQAMAPEEARSFWERFSTWMEEHRGDLAGFAAQEGFASVHPSVEGGRPVLRVSRSAAQRPYAAVRDRGPHGGSDSRDASLPGGGQTGARPLPRTENGRRKRRRP